MTIPSSAVNALGLVLLQFVWQGTALGLVLGFALLLVPRGWARVRYLLACLTLAAMVAAPMATAAHYAGDGGSAIAAPAALTAPIVAAVTTGGSLSLAPASHSAGLASQGTSIPWIDWFVAAWAIGVLLSAVRLAGGWAHARRLLREDACVADERWSDAVTRIAARLRIRRPVRLLESARVQVPVVIGALQPVLLLPASALSGLAPAQIEAVLAHELAHIRRHDYLVNLLQSAAETLLFYHPAVWWVSHTIRVEREHCCDDLAVSACGDAVLYARALTAIETMRQEHGGLALAVSDGSLLARVRRLLGVPAPPRLASSAWVVAAVTALLVAGAGLASHAGDLAHLLPHLQFAEALEAQAGPAQLAADQTPPRPPSDAARPRVPLPPAPPSGEDQDEVPPPPAAAGSRWPATHDAITSEQEARLRQDLDRTIRDATEAASRELALHADVDRAAIEAAIRESLRATEEAARAMRLDRVERDALRQAHEAMAAHRGEIDRALADAQRQVARELRAHRGEIERAMAEVSRTLATTLEEHRGEIDQAIEEAARALAESSRALGHAPSPPPPPPPAPAARPVPAAPPAPAAPPPAPADAQPAPPPPPPATPDAQPAPPAPPAAPDPPQKGATRMIQKSDRHDVPKLMSRSLRFESQRTRRSCSRSAAAALLAPTRARAVPGPIGELLEVAREFGIDAHGLTSRGGAR